MMTRVSSTTEMRQPRSDEWKGVEVFRDPEETSRLAPEGRENPCTQDASLRATWIQGDGGR
eukprot:5754382-Pyramimonas_sp.AAC.1